MLVLWALFWDVWLARLHTGDLLHSLHSTNVFPGCFQGALVCCLGPADRMLLECL